MNFTIFQDGKQNICEVVVSHLKKVGSLFSHKVLFCLHFAGSGFDVAESFASTTEIQQRSHDAGNPIGFN